VELAHHSRKDIGVLGEKVAGEYLRRQGMKIIDRNVTRKTGEIDLIARKGKTLHFVEVKSMVCEVFPRERSREDTYDPTANLHEAKIRRVARTSEWYAANIGWEDEWQVDAVLVWLRKHDGRALVRYLPQIA
jgi:Holliday junction resolvase-like predicted endonuclease